MSDRKALGDEPPLPPGTAPFHVKGGSFLGHLAWVDANYPGGREAFLAALSPSMREYFGGVFLATGWYDALALASAGYVCAKTLDMPYRAFIALRARHQAETDLSGMYRLLLKIASPRMVASRIPKVMMQYLDFGSVRIVRDEPDGVTFEVSGIPQILADWYLGAYEGFLEVVLAAAGGKEPSARAEVLGQKGAHRFPTVTLRIDSRWS